VQQRPYVAIDELFDPAGADAMVELCERFGRYGMYSQEHVESEIGRGLVQRQDAFQNFMRSGGRGGAGEDEFRTLAARTNYFREEYAYGQTPKIAGIEPFLNHDAFMDAARKVHDRPVIEPAIAFANLMVPGQELAVHTDVPEFRGCNRKVMPQWLIVAMHHSGLFEEWRMPIATAVSWFHDCDGGEFAFYPDGADAPPVALAVGRNTAIVLDADSTFHGVDRIASKEGGVAPLRPGMTLDFAGDRTWVVHDGDDVIETYDWDELRFSVSWKAYCFTDEHEQRTWRENTDDLSLDVVVERLVADLRDRDAITSQVPPNPDLGLLIIDTYIRFPGA
jgi:hypothetical protein